MFDQAHARNRCVLNELRRDSRRGIRGRSILGMNRCSVRHWLRSTAIADLPVLVQKSAFQRQTSGDRRRSCAVRGCTKLFPSLTFSLEIVRR